MVYAKAVMGSSNNKHGDLITKSDEITMLMTLIIFV
jgi:hypothetical protein